MVAYRIVCTAKERWKPHARREHIVSVGVTRDATKTMLELVINVAKVRESLDTGDQFFTVGPDSGKRAGVRKFTCRKCGLRTIRSRKDAVVDNNLDNLPSC
jgi:hypothetical protein